MSIHAGDLPVVMRCEHCDQPARHRCSRCKAFAVCRQECLAAAWRKHKPDCDKVFEARKRLQSSGASLSGQGVPFSISPDELGRLNRRTMAVYQKHGVNLPPGRGSSMDVEKKLAFFLDVLREHDTSSPENKSLSLPEKLFLNRRYNNTYRHALETFPPREIAQLNAMMHARHVGAANR